MNREAGRCGNPRTAAIEKTPPPPQRHGQDRRGGDHVAEPLEGKFGITPAEDKSGQESPGKRPHLREPAAPEIQDQGGMVIVGPEVPDIFEGPRPQEHGEERPSDHTPGFIVVHPVEPKTPHAPEHCQRERQHPKHVIGVERYRADLEKNGKHIEGNPRMGQRRLR